jgi:nonsense-mediated mRNA decay protein 3
MTYQQPLTANQIPCCLCGTMIFSNAANQCSTCLAQEIDLKGMLQQGSGGADYTTIHQCRQCRRYQQSEKYYVDADPESPTLLAIVLKHIPALSSNNTLRLNLVDAGFIWTEPHSMRLKVHLTVRTEIHGTVIQQRVSVELLVHWKMCPQCNQEATHRTWHAIVQVRQKRDNKAGLTAIEQALAKNSLIRKYVLQLDAQAHGYDYFFFSLSQAQTFCAYLQRITAMRIKTSQHLVSSNIKNSTTNLRHTVMCDVVPLCRNDLVLIHKSVASNKLAGRLVLVDKVSSVIHFLDASPKRNSNLLDDCQTEVSPETFYKNEKFYRLLLDTKRLTRFVVLDVELCNNEEHVLYHGPDSGVTKYALADVQVARESEFGVVFSTVSHMGHLLSPGDVVLGYDLVASATDFEDCLLHNYVLPDVVLVKKAKREDGEAKESASPEQEQGGKRISKKKLRRQRFNEGKKKRDLEESAIRMGFLEENEEDQLDPDLEAELTAMERDLASFDTPSEDGNP